MKIIILGNGYDLSNGLPTSYDDFFNYRMPDVECTITEITEILKEEFPEDYNTYFNELFSTGNIFNREDISNRKNNLIYTEINAVYSDIKSRIMKVIEQKNVCFWDLYFYKLRESKDLPSEIEWNDVENRIQLLIMNKLLVDNYINKDELKKKYIKYARVTGFKKSVVKTKENQLNKNILYFIDQQEIMNLIEYIILYSYMDSEDNIYEGLLKNLEIFENNFQRYINIICNQLLNDKEGYLYNLYTVANNTSEKIYIINFNYTSISILDDTQKYPTIFEIKKGILHNSVIENNVHGRFNTNIIFGIDQQGLKPMDKEYIFSKTYRKMRSLHTLNNNPLPPNQQVTEIIFFGHSLSEADYSYFQSIFDFYDIYNSNIILSFKYSEYGDLATRKRCLVKHIDGITKLLGAYGETMNNRKHGENLSHKLMLENRLHIENVTEDLYRKLHKQK